MKAARFTRGIVKIISHWVKLPKFCLIKVSVFNYWIKKSVYVLLKGTTQSVNWCFRYYVCMFDWNGTLLLSFTNPSTLRFTSNWSKVIKRNAGYIAVSACFPWEPLFLFAWHRHAYIFYWNAHFKSSFRGPGFNYCCKKCRSPIFLNQSLL